MVNKQIKFIFVWCSSKYDTCIQIYKNYFHFQFSFKSTRSAAKEGSDSQLQNKKLPPPLLSHVGQTFLSSWVLSFPCIFLISPGIVFEQILVKNTNISLLVVHHSQTDTLFEFFLFYFWETLCPIPCFVLLRQKRMMGMTLSENELIDVENHYPTERIPMESKEKSTAENLLEKMIETQWVAVSSFQELFRA